MCGIAGRILTEPGQVGADLVALMAAQSHRGADSTGFAIYGEPRSHGYILRGMGFDKNKLDTDLEDFKNLLGDHKSDYLSEPTIVSAGAPHYSFRLEISDPDDLTSWVEDADSISHRIEIQSCGRALEIIKDVGDAGEVAEKHGVHDLIGTHGLGHARLATESSVLPNASHPFWARPFSDVAIVHNGQITDYHSWRERLQRLGYRFLTENDSELIAVWISDRIKSGMSMQQALKKSITSIDGVFTYMIANTDGIGFAKDRYAMKPLVVIDGDGNFAAATEEQAVRRIFTEESAVTNIDGPAMSGIWSLGEQRRVA